MSAVGQEAYLEFINVTGEDMEMVKLECAEDVQIIKDAFRLRFPVFCTNILKILLHREEENLACFLTAYYEVSLTP